MKSFQLTFDILLLPGPQKIKEYFSLWLLSHTLLRSDESRMKMVAKAQMTFLQYIRK